jgi:hypothetical protein
MGLQGQTTANQLGELVEKLRDVGVAREEARSTVAALVRTPELSVAEIPRLAGMAPDLAAATGVTTSQAARQLADVATGGYDAIIKLDRALNGFLNPSQRENIRLLSQQGESTAAYKIAIDALEVRIKGLNDQALSPTQKSLNDIGRAWDRLVDNLAKGAVGRVTLSIVEGTISGAANLMAPSKPPVRDHIGDALRPVGGQLVFEIKWGERTFDIRRQNLGGRGILHGFQHQRDNALGDRGIAVRQKMEVAPVLRRRIDPDAGGAATHKRRIGFERIGHRFQFAPQIDEQAVTVVAVEEFIFLLNVGQAGHGFL